MQEEERGKTKRTEKKMRKMRWRRMRHYLFTILPPCPPDRMVSNLQPVGLHGNAAAGLPAAEGTPQRNTDWLLDTKY